LHHLDRCAEILGAHLMTVHNLHYYQELMAGLRAAIAGGNLADFVAAFHEGQQRGEAPVFQRAVRAAGRCRA
jgi:queuine tRNA-ribosyltransferase